MYLAVAKIKLTKFGEAMPHCIVIQDTEQGVSILLEAHSASQQESWARKLRDAQGTQF